MDNVNDTPASHPNPENNFPGTTISDTTVTASRLYPAKPELEENKSKTNVWVRSISSLALYFVIGYFFFNRDWVLVLILTAVVVFHEMGHFLAMKLYNYTDLGIFFIPLLGAYASGTKREVSQKQSVVIILAGPVPGIIAGILIYFLALHQDSLFLEKTALFLILLNVINLIPVYPLDGGQLLNRLFLDESAIIGRVFSVLSCLFIAWFFINLGMQKNLLYVLLVIPVMMLIRMFSDIKHERLVTKIEKEGVDLNTAYEDITDEQYWNIRNAMIRHHPDLRGIPQAPPYQYAEDEDKIVSTMQGLLQRVIIMDLSVAGKILVILVWVGCFAASILMKMPWSIFY
jgi:stage IV sporulation protein FB